MQILGIDKAAVELLPICINYKVIGIRASLYTKVG